MKRKISVGVFFNFVGRAALSTVCILAVLFMPEVCPAEEGDLDPSFGIGGLVTTNFMGSNRDNAQDSDVVAIQPDGKIVVVGSTSSFSGIDFGVVRYHADGSLDASFGDGGKVTTTFGSNSGVPYALAIQDNGKIVVAGITGSNYSTTGYDFALVRYNSDGTLDSSFDDDGLVTTDFAFNYDLASSVVIQPDGKIVVGGYTCITSTPTNYDFALARYNADGSLDTTFDIDGLVTTEFGSAYDYIYGITIQSDNKIIVCGRTVGITLGSDFALARYNVDGSLDSGFGDGGMVTTNLRVSDSASEVILQTSGKIVVAGSSSYFSRRYFALARYNSDGSLDSTFGSGGWVLTNIGFSNGALAAEVQSDDKIIAVGALNIGTPSHWVFALLRYNEDGSLDSDFGIDGLVASDFGDRSMAISVAIQSDGGIFVAGRTNNGAPSYQDFALARYDTYGDLDYTFGTDGLVTTDFLASHNDKARDIVAIQGDGKIVVVGSTQGSYGMDFAAARYNQDGSLDSGFGDGGFVMTDTGENFDQALAVVMQADGKIVIGGQASGSVVLVRYNTDGSLDNTFDIDGIVKTKFSSGNVYTNGIAIQADGKIVVAGYNYGTPSTYNDFFLARYNTDGSLDTGFGVGGLVTTDFGSRRDYAYDLAIQADGKIVVVGDSTSGSSYSYDLAIARYNSDGNLDTTFDGDGLVTTDFDGGHDNARGVSIQDNGKIIVAGFAIYQYAMEFALACYNPDGSLDATFDGDGLVTTDFGLSNDRAFAVTIQADGKIVAAGSSQSSYSNDYDFALARYNLNGSLDTDFGSSGLVTTDFNFLRDWAYGVAIQADGKIVVAGETDSGTSNHYDFAVARYEGLGSPHQRLELLIGQVQALVPDPLNDGQANSLQVKLQGAIQKLDKEQVDTAINKLQAFINEVSAFISGGILTSEQGQPLISAAQTIIDSLLP